MEEHYAKEEEQRAYIQAQGDRCRELFAAVVLAALNDAILDDKKYGTGEQTITRWARSRDGQEVIICAGIDPNERTVQGMVAFVAEGIPTATALAQTKESNEGVGCN